MAKLVINPTSSMKKEIPIVARVISIGRDPSNDLVLSDSMVSRRHAILEHRDDQYILRDNNSSNGTMVNGDRVDNEKPLRDGDLVAIGSSRLLFQLDDTAEASIAPSRKSEAVAARPAAGRPLPPRPGGGAEGPRCPSCGKQALDMDRFCRGCGKDLGRARKSVLCGKCGLEVPLPADFCGSCGTVLSGTERDSFLATRPQRRVDLEPLPPKSSGPEAADSPVRPRPRHHAAMAFQGAPGAEPAGFGIRLLAFLVDDVILGIPILLGGLIWMAFAVGGPPSTRLASSWATLLAASYALLCALYYVFFWASRGATPGKNLLGLIIRTETGETPIGYPRAMLRLVGYFLSSALLGIGFLWILWSEDHCGLHDSIAGTRVTRSS